jgi:hypothetical protein
MSLSRGPAFTEVPASWLVEPCLVPCLVLIPGTSYLVLVLRDASAAGSAAASASEFCV